MKGAETIARTAVESEKAAVEAQKGVRKWRALRESNPPLQRERLTS